MQGGATIDGILGYIAPSDLSCYHTIALYQLHKHEIFYTGSETEAQQAVTIHGYTLDRTAGYVFLPDAINGNSCDTTPPTVVFDAPPPASRAPFGVQIPFRWIGTDEAGGSGLAGYTFQFTATGGLAPQAVTLLSDSPATLATLTLDRPCRTLTPRVTAVDTAGNRSLPADAPPLIVNPRGDLSGEGMLDSGDLAALDAAWGTTTGQAGFQPQLDVTEDGRIDNADRMWLVRRLGNRCP